ncbi:hypothetical protein ETB97_007038 [Aspergillus alliaceus]|uniref:Uncharacterized protein n=1 Tax=Petromyces alliaceus TaxID=209559 RepID=A0A8H6E222_PETAA|nr:hypothetical protein ETB97_007038 [Aspergillus burnettii]
MSDLEVTTGEKVAVGGGGNGGPAQASVNVEHSKGIKTSYEGARVIHGLIKGSDSATWRLFEDSASATGLPPVIHLLLVVCCASNFSLDLEMSVTHRSFWRMPFNVRSHKVSKGLSCLIPSLEDVETFENMEGTRKVKRLLLNARRCTQTENGRLEQFENILNSGLADINHTGHPGNISEQTEGTILSNITAARNKTLSDWEADILLHHYASIRSDIRGRKERQHLAGEKWDGMTRKRFAEGKETRRAELSDMLKGIQLRFKTPLFTDQMKIPGGMAGQGLQSVQNGAECIEASDPPAKPEMNSNIAPVAIEGHFPTDIVQNLGDAVSNRKMPLSAVAKDYPDQIQELDGIERMFSDGYAQTWSIEDLEDAISIIRRAIDITPEDHPESSRTAKQSWEITLRPV